MVFPLLIGITGVIFGAIFFSEGGWLIGAALGFLIGKVVQLEKKILTQDREMSRFKSLLENLDSQTISVSTTEIKRTELSQVNHPQFETPQVTNSETNLLKTSPLNTDQTLVIDVNIDDIIKPNHQETNQTKTHIQHEIHSDSQGKQSLEEKAINWLRSFFLGGNPVVRIGMLILFIGLSFLVKYAAGQGYFPIEFRLSCVAIIAILLIIIGWKTRAREGGYGLVLQGGGLAALYLTSFAAAKMYQLMPTSIALCSLFIFVIFGVILAILQNAQVLAIVAIAGGFLAPILTSDGSGNHIGLFSVYVILNLGILFISWFKTWRLLNWIGFVFTFVITVFWGVSRYEPQFYASTQPFLILFFLMYLTISVLFSLKQPPNLKGLVDGSLVFGLPIAGFSLQVALLKHTEYGLAISAIVLAILYIGLARWLWSIYLHTHKLLAESFLALGVGFATLAIPLGLNADWTSATWAFEAIGLLWIGLRQQRLLPRVAAIGLYFAACVATFADSGIHAGDTPMISGDFFGLCILTLSGILMAYIYFRFSNFAFSGELWVGKCLLCISQVWWVIAVLLEVDAHVTNKLLISILHLVFAASLIGQLAIGIKLKWSSFSKLAHSYIALVFVLTLYGFVDSRIHFPTDQWWGLPILGYFVAQYLYLLKMEQLGWKTALGAAHLASGLWVLLLLLWQANGVATHTQFLQSIMPQETARLFIWFLIFAPAVICLMMLNIKNLWPASNWKTYYQDVIPSPFILIILIWITAASHHSGKIVEFYLPVLNPIDLTQLASILMLGYVMRLGLSFTQHWNLLFQRSILGLLVFIWINLILLRSIHHYFNVPFNMSAFWYSADVQMALSILWTVCALVIMSISRRIQERKLWMVGAGILTIVILKLAFKDLSGSGTLSGIISFVGVGILMLLIGYLSPIPTKKVITGAEEK